MNPGDSGLVEALFGSYPGLVVVLDPQLRYLRFNERHAGALEALTGVVPRVGVPILGALADEDRRRISQGILERALAGETFTTDSTFALGRAEPRSFRITYLPVRTGETGPVEALLLTAVDITAELSAREASVLGDRRLKEALAAGETGYWTYDVPTGEVYFSEGFYAMLGFGPGEFPMTLAGWTDRVHPGDRPGTLGQLRSLFQTEPEGFQVEYRMKTSTGGWRWIQSRGRVVGRETDGTARRIAGTNVDVTRRKLTEQALAESEARWTSLVDEVPVGISLIGRDGGVLFENRRESATNGGPALGMNWLDFLAPELHIPVREALDSTFSEGKPSVFPTYRLLADGTALHFENHASPVRNDGSVTAVLVLSIDVTAQRRTEVRRAKANRRMEILLSLHNNPRSDLRTLFHVAVDAAVELTSSRVGFLDFYSEETRTFTRHYWSRDLRTFCTVPEPPDEYPLVSAGFWAESVRRGVPVLVNEFSSPDPLRRGFPSGHFTVTRFLSVPVFEQGRIVALVAVGNKVLPYDEDDVDELRILAESLWHLKARIEAEEALQRLYQAVEHSPVSIVITDPQGAAEYANPRFLAQTGASAGEILGAVPRFLGPEAVTQPVLDTLWATVRAGKEWQGELEDLSGPAGPQTHLVSVSPVLTSGGTITHIVAVSEDITGRKAAQDLLARAQKMELVGQLAAGVAHDFNNLLTSVLGYNEMLLRKLEPDHPLRIYAERIELSGRRAAALVASLLAVGRQQRLTKVRADLADWLAEEEPLLASLVKGGAVFKTELDPGPLWTEIDPGQLSQVVVNLVSNAQDAVEGPGTIVLSSGRDGGPAPGNWVWFRVTDSGPGIPKELREKIFDPFFTTKPIGKGTGLGLSIVQGIVHQHGGQITLDSAEARGTRFTVWLPPVTPGP